MIRNLTAEENLERKRYNLSKALNKPVYICSTLNKHGTHYKRPGEEHYETIGRLEAFLSQWSDGGFCKKREEENFYYDLSPASVLYLAYPLKKKEDVDRESIQLINLQHSLNERVVVYLGAEEKVPRELTEYVDEYRVTSHKKRIGICFARSEPICTPAELQKDWHLGFTTDKLVTLQGPGWYSAPGEAYGFGNDNNRVGITDTNPGPCIICRGAKMVRRHFGVIGFGPGAYLINLVCAECAESTFSSWLKILKTSPINLKPKEGP